MTNYVSDYMKFFLSYIMPKEEEFYSNVDFESLQKMYFETSYIIENVIAFRLDVSEKTAAVETAETELDLVSLLSSGVSLISNEIERATCTEVDVHTFALSLFQTLCDKEYRSNFMLLGTLAAFAASKGIWLLALKFICTDSSEESLLMVLKKVEGLFIESRYMKNERKGEKTHNDLEFYLYISLLSSLVTRKSGDNWKSMGSLYNLIEVMFNVGSVALTIRKDYFDLMPIDLQSDFNRLLLLTIYWVISGVFACSSQCNKLPQNEYVIQDSKMLRDIQDQLISIHENLLKYEKIGRDFMDDQMISNQYGSGPGGRLFMDLFDQSDEVRFLRHKRMDRTLLVGIWGKNNIFMLLISDLDISFNEINFLKEFYTESKKSAQLDFELAWLPICSGPWTSSMEEKYKKLRQMMTWYTIDHQRLITEETKKFIKDSWKFHKQPFIVAVADYNRTIFPFAIHLMHIWGSKAFPFTRQRERELWSAETTLNSLVLGFDKDILSTLQAGICVIIYGGNDINWIQKLTNCVREVFSDLGIEVQLYYVGKNREVKAYTSEKTWYFWTRLESLLILRHHMFATASDNGAGGAMDPFIQEIEKLLSYNSTTLENWAGLITPSSSDLMMIHGNGDTMLQAFMDYKSWKHSIHFEEFPKYFKDYVDELGRLTSDRACCRIVLSIDNKDTIDNLKCPDCLNPMQKKVVYKCCHMQEEEEHHEFQ